MSGRGILIGRKRGWTLFSRGCQRRILFRGKTHEIVVVGQKKEYESDDEKCQ